MGQSVLQKSKNKLISIGKEEIVNKVDSMHTILRTRLNGGNMSTAKQAEEFLNWLIFNKNNHIASSSLNEEYRNELLKNPAIKKIVRRFNQYVNLSQSYSNKLSLSKKISDEAYKKMQARYGLFSNIRGLKTEDMFVDLINNFVSNNIVESTGQKSATVVVKKWAENFMKDISLYGEEEIKKLIKDNKFLRYKGKSMKADTSSNGNIEYTITVNNPDNYINACIAVFSNSSLKSVNDVKKIHLEEVNINKAYTAFMNFAYSNKYLTQKAIKNIFNDYYKTNTTDDYEYVTRHLNHLLRVYAYSGFGTSPLSDLQNISKGVEYLVVIDNLKKHIYIKSSTEVINFLLQYNRKTLSPNVILNLQVLLNSKNLTK